MSKPVQPPPWVLFCDKGKPVAILPAMRSGEVAKVSHLTMKQAQKIVTLANELHQELFLAKLDGLQATIAALAIAVAKARDPR